MYDNTFSFHVDGNNVNDELELLGINEAIVGKNVSVQQIISGYSEGKLVKLADFRIQHFLDIEGIIDYRGVMYARNNFTVTTGYPLMLPVNKETLNRVVTSYGNSKLNSGDNSEYFFSEENGES